LPTESTVLASRGGATQEVFAMPAFIERYLKKSRPEDISMADVKQFLYKPRSGRAQSVVPDP
jgi:hypothetical protein